MTESFTCFSLAKLLSDEELAHLRMNHKLSDEYSQLVYFPRLSLNNTAIGTSYKYDSLTGAGK